MKRILLALVALAAVAGLPAIAQMWPNFPVAGGASYCASTVNGVCQSTIAAGPALTGAETVPADTNATQGVSPQTVKITSANLQTNGVALVSGVATTYTVVPGIYNVVLTHSTTIDSSAITAPAAPIDGQRVRIGADHTVTAFSFVANTGQTLAVTTPTVLTASTTVPQGYEFIYVASTAKWYRLQ